MLEHLVRARLILCWAGPWIRLVLLRLVLSWLSFFLVGLGLVDLKANKKADKR
jgi:hypothetical protein